MLLPASSSRNRLSVGTALGIRRIMGVGVGGGASVAVAVGVGADSQGALATTGQTANTEAVTATARERMRPATRRRMAQ